MRIARSFALAALLAGVAAIPAQSQLALRGGYDLTNFFGDGIQADNRQELGFGGSFGIVSFGPVVLMAEAYYRQKGADNVQAFDDQLMTLGAVEFGIDYVEVPVLLRLNLPDLGGRVVPYLSGGPTFAWRVDCGVTIHSVSQTIEESCDDLMGQNLEETLRDYEQGFVLGGGLDFVVGGGTGAINLDARMTQGLSRINENADGTIGVKNRVFSMMLGYSFGIPGGLDVPGMGQQPR